MTSLAQWQLDLEHASGSADRLAKRATRKADIKGSTGFAGPELPGPALMQVLKDNTPGARSLLDESNVEVVGRDPSTVEATKPVGFHTGRAQANRSTTMDPRVVGDVADSMAKELGDQGAKLLGGD